MSNKMDTDKKRGVTVKEGDSITVSAQGIKVTGVVATVDHWGDHMGWHIEIDKANVQGGYSSWKQNYDGGWISELNGQPMGKRFKTEGYVLTVFNEDDSIAYEGKYIRTDSVGRFILEERPWSKHPDDHYLSCVLAYFGTKGEFVTWMFNKEFSSTNFGHFFTNHEDALLDFEGRNK